MRYKRINPNLIWTNTFNCKTRGPHQVGARSRKCGVQRVNCGTPDLKSVSGQQLQIRQVVEDLAVNLFTVQGAEPLKEKHTDSVLGNAITTDLHDSSALHFLPTRCLAGPGSCQVEKRLSPRERPDNQR